MIVTVVAVNGVAPTPPAPTTTTDADGRYSFVVPIGDVAIRAALDAYTAATRVSTVVADQSGAVFDIRLTPETVVSAKANGSADITDRELQFDSSRRGGGVRVERSGGIVVPAGAAVPYAAGLVPGRGASRSSSEPSRTRPPR